jgi:hypothetical protein
LLLFFLGSHQEPEKNKSGVKAPHSKFAAPERILKKMKNPWRIFRANSDYQEGRFANASPGRLALVEAQGEIVAMDEIARFRCPHCRVLTTFRPAIHEAVCGAGRTESFVSYQVACTHCRKYFVFTAYKPPDAGAIANGGPEP